MKTDELLALAEREREQQRTHRCRFFCCSSTACISAGGTRVREGVQAAIDAAGLGAAAQVVPTGCQGLCSSAP